MADIAGLKAALDAAEADKTALVEERRVKRDELTKAAFRAYNEETRVRQIEVQAAVDAAQAALHSALNSARQELLVGTVSETNTGV